MTGFLSDEPTDRLRLPARRNRRTVALTLIGALVPAAALAVFTSISGAPVPANGGYAAVPAAVTSSTTLPTPTPTSTPSPTTTTTVQPTTTTTAPGESATDLTALHLIDGDRAKAGCGPLTWNATLGRVAYGHSEDMAVHRYFDHNTPSGETPFQRMRAAGFLNAAAEVIAAGQSTAAATVDAWMGDAPHRDILLNCGYHEIGIGEYVLSSSPYHYYWTADFGF